MSCQTQDLEIIEGSTFTRVVRWEAAPLIYRAITAITRAGPVAITSAAHGLTAGWRAAVLSAGGMRQINAKSMPPRDSDFHAVTVTSSSVVAFNDVNSQDYTAYTSGGSLVYWTAHDLASYTARMQVRATEASTTTLLSLTTENAGIALDDTAKTITLTITATATAALTFTEGVYDLELVSGGGVVTKILHGAVTVTQEVTR